MNPPPPFDKPRHSASVRQSDPEIIEEADDWIVVNKPPQMAAHPSKPGDRDTLWHYLTDLLAYERVNGGQVSIITRLDRETSGLTLVAKTKDCARSFCRQMEAHKIRKAYVALVWNWPAQDQWEIDAPIERKGIHTASPIWLKQTIHPEGSTALTSFEVIERFSQPSSNGEKFALVRAFPETGRMHQIRVHLQASGHPIVGDKIYGPDENCYLEFIETGWTSNLEQTLLLPRHALHAERLLLEENGQTWSAPLAPDIAAFREGYSPIFKRT